MQKADAEKMLLQCASGTFLIQFSEGEPGGISVAWVTGEKRYVPFKIFTLLLYVCVFKLYYASEGDMVSGERQVFLHPGTSMTYQ